MKTYTFLKCRQNNKWYSLKKFNFSNKTNKMERKKYIKWHVNLQLGPLAVSLFYFFWVGRSPLAFVSWGMCTFWVLSTIKVNFAPKLWLTIWWFFFFTFYSDWLPNWKSVRQLFELTYNFCLLYLAIRLLNAPLISELLKWLFVIIVYWE